MNDGLNFSVFRAVRPHHSVIVLLLLQSSAVSGQHQVVGPSHPTVALVGDDIILPCRVEPAVSVLEMTVEWARLDLDPRFVYVWHDGMELESKKHPSYSGRTSVSINKLKTGDISLKLSEVKHSDRGRFKCFIPDLGASSVDLVVGAVSSPFIVSINRTSSHLILQCEAKGWYPEPELFWLDAEGNLLSAGPTETVRGPDDLYTVSRRLTVRKSGSFTCRVQQKNITQTRETHFYVPEDFFMVQSSLIQAQFIILIIIISTIIFTLCFLCILALVASVQNLIYKRKEETGGAVRATEATGQDGETADRRSTSSRRDHRRRDQRQFKMQ